jgi:nicotinamidase-related amidase
MAASQGAAIYLEPSTPVAETISPLDPASTALLVMDYQDAWLRTLVDPEAVIAQAATAIATAREHDVLVAYAQVTLTAADYAAVPDHNIIFNQIARPPGVLDADAPGNAIDERVAPEPSDKVIRKTRVSAFDRTDLDEWLRGMGIDTLILAGISTSGVVLSTICDGADLDYRLLVLADACTDRDPVIQSVLMERVFPQRATVITVENLPGLLAPA